MAAENPINSIAADSASERAQQDREAFARSLAGLSTIDGADINSVLAHATQTRDLNGVETPAPTGEELSSYVLDLEYAGYLAQEHANASLLIENMIDNGVPRREAVAEVSAAIPEYQQVENARIAIQGAYQIETGGAALNPNAVASSLGFDITNAYRHNDCLLYTSPSPRDQRGSRMPSSA